MSYNPYEGMTNAEIVREKRKLTRERLAEIRGTPRFDWRPFFTMREGGDPVKFEADLVKFTPVFDEYFKSFASYGGPCLGCETSSRASIEWALMRGEAYCVHCGYPFRVYHHDVGPFSHVTLALPYHPETLEVKS